MNKIIKAKKKEKIVYNKQQKEMRKFFLDVYNDHFSHNRVEEFKKKEKTILRENGDYGDFILNLKDMCNKSETKCLLENYKKEIEVNNIILLHSHNKENKELKEEIESLDINIRKIKNYLHKLNDYMKITKEVYEDYGYRKIILTFTNSNKKKLLKWCKNNNLPVGYTTYHIDSIYDCTGEITSKNVVVKSNKIIICETYDV